MKRVSARYIARIALRYALLILASGFALAPLLWGLSTSFKAPAEILALPPRWLPDALHWENYRASLMRPRFAQYFANSLSVVALALVLSLAAATHAAYALARRDFRGKEVFAFVLWGTVMIPSVAIIVPLYLIAVDVGLYDTHFGLALVFAALLTPTLIWLLRGFVEAVPIELEEAARVDGCSPLKTFYIIVVPLLRPGIGAAAILVFVTIWNDFLVSYSLTLKDSNRLVQVGLYAFVTELGIEHGPLMAGAIGATLPILIAFALLQRHFIRGFTGGAVKG